MTIVRSDELSHLGLQVGLLTALYAQQPSEIRAVHIRRAERALLSLEEFAQSSIPDEARQWLQAKDAYCILRRRLDDFEKLKSTTSALQAEIEDLTKTLRMWNALQDAERQKFLQNHQRAKQFTEQSLAVAESHILHKYARYKAMNRLLPYADNAEHLCDAIFHFQNRLKYEENIQKSNIDVKMRSSVWLQSNVALIWHCSCAFFSHFAFVSSCGVQFVESSP